MPNPKTSQTPKPTMSRAEILAEMETLVRDPKTPAGQRGRLLERLLDAWDNDDEFEGRLR